MLICRQIISLFEIRSFLLLVAESVLQLQMILIGGFFFKKWMISFAE